MTVLTGGERVQRLLGNGKVGVDRIELLERHQRRPHRHILPEVDVAQAEPAGERRPDRLLGDDGAGAFDGRGGGIARGERGVDGRLRGVALDDQRFLAGERRVRVLELGEAVREVRLLDRIVDVDEQRAGFDVFARLEMLGGDHSRRLRRDDDALIGAQRADRRQFRRPFLGLDRLGGHRRRLRREGRGDEPLHHHRLDDELEIGEPAGQRDEERQHDHEHDRALGAERQQPNDQEKRENGGGRAEGKRGKRDVQAPELRRRARRSERERKQKQQPVGKPPHRSPSVRAGFSPAFCNISPKNETIAAPAHRGGGGLSPAPARAFMVGKRPQRGGLIRENDAMIKTLALALALGVAGAPALAYADDACMTQAMDKKLAGAAKTSFMTKCERTTCEGQAKDKNLHGAAMTSFVKKCTKDAMTM